MGETPITRPRSLVDLDELEALVRVAVDAVDEVTRMVEFGHDRVLAQYARAAQTEIHNLRRRIETTSNLADRGPSPHRKL